MVSDSLVYILPVKFLRRLEKALTLYFTESDNQPGQIHEAGFDSYMCGYGKCNAGVELEAYLSMLGLKYRYLFYSRGKLFHH